MHLKQAYPRVTPAATSLSDLSTEKNYSYYSIYVGTTKEALPEVEKLILAGFDSVKNMTEQDLKATKERIIGLRRLSSEESAEVINELLFAELTHDAQNYYLHEEKIKKVTLEEVKSLAKITKFSTAAIVPK